MPLFATYKLQCHSDIRNASRKQGTKHNKQIGIDMKTINYGNTFRNFLNC